MIRKASIVTVALILVSLVYGCITINQISPSSTEPAFPAAPTRTAPPETITSPTVPPLTTLPPAVPPFTTPPLTTPPFSIPTFTPANPLPSVVPTTPVVTEDCIGFNYINTTTQNSNGKWLVISGGSSLLNFEGNQAGANLAVNIIKFYQMDSMCFVGRPNAPMIYFLSNGSSPVGAYPNEDAIGFNPANVTAQNIGGKWIVADGSSYLLNFESNQAGANTAVAIIQKYGFTRICFVARPNPPMVYFRK